MSEPVYKPEEFVMMLKGKLEGRMISDVELADDVYVIYLSNHAAITIPFETMTVYDPPIDLANGGKEYRSSSER